MAFYLSPLVDVNEIDLTTTIPAVATSIAVTVLRKTYKGPELKKTLITDKNELIDIFGEPTSTADCYQDILSAIGYLKYGNKLYCTRVMPDEATFSGTKTASGSRADFTAFTTEDAYTLSDFDSKDPDEFPSEVDFVGDEEMQFIASSRGEWGNNIRIAIFDYSTYSEIISAGSYSNWDTYEAVSSIDEPLLDSKDFLVLVSVKDQSDTSYSLKEAWNVSTSTIRRDDQGQIKFCEAVINEQSDYIRMAIASDKKNEDIDISNSSWQYFGGGQDSADDYVTDDVTDTIIMDAIDLYGDAEEIDVNIFIDSNKSDVVKRYLISTCESRLDSMAILDCKRTDVINNRGNETTDLRTYRRSTLNENTSYAALFGNWLEVYDRWSGIYRWIPASGHVAGIMAHTDQVADPWWAPAGLNRAILDGVRKLAWNPSLGNRDVLYMNGINPIVSFSGQGKVIWGQKTLLDKSSAFNRINVRRLFMVLEKSISTAVKYFLFEPNDEFTRLSLINMITPYLRDVQARRGIYNYEVVCDSRNNTPERIDRNELWCDLYIKPVRAAEFIVLNFIATKTGASFEEIITGDA